jgi:GntR family transcriptional regulator/MocR family aminotransferase
MPTGPLLQLELDRARPLGRQLEGLLRGLIRSEALPLGARLPATRVLATDLGVSRGVVVGAYAQLAAEGYLALRRGAAPVVAARSHEVRPVEGEVEPDVPIARARFNLRPDVPDLGLFPRRAWLAAERAVLRCAANTDLAYGEPFGSIALRRQLASFLVRTRGVVAHADRVNVVAGSSQGLLVLALLLRNRGVRRIAIEDPGHRWRSRVLLEAGLELVPVPVDEFGLRVEQLPDVAALVVSADHHYPLGVTLVPDRRRLLVDWAVAGNRLIIEHDYDGHFRYAGPAPGALQNLAPEHVAYVGSASALLAPTLRLGWSVLPAALIVPFAELLFTTVGCTPRLTQLALAELIATGSLERHLRKARSVYRRRREVLVATIARHLPDAVVGGAPAGLFVPVSLPRHERVVLAAARDRGIVVDGLSENALAPMPPTLVIGFAAEPEARLRRAVRELAAVLAGA